ncbi:DNA mismatch repair protein MutS [Actinomadura viridis]
MFPDADVPPVVPESATLRELVDDLALEELWAGMARGDGRLHMIARAALLAPLTDPAAITYRQEVLGDCLRNESAVRALYELAGRALAEEQKIIRGGASPEARLNGSLRALETFCGHLRRLSAFAAANADGFGSAGFARLFRMIRDRLDGKYLTDVEALLERIDFEQGIIATARLGESGRGVDFRLQEPPVKGRGSSTQRRLKKAGLSHSIWGRHDEDWRMLAAFRGRVLEVIADAADESAGNVRGFFAAMRDELGFYVGCLNLAGTLSRSGLPICLPRPCPPGERAFTARGLYEPGLALRRGGAVVANDVAADGIGLVVITGANRGGKTTFLRSVGLAHLMMQSGMFVTARSLAASVVGGVFTHFKREADASMTSGRLDGELARMSAVVDVLRTGDLVLCNESFMSTNEREGSDISTEIVSALTDHGIRVMFVTHLHDFAQRMRTARPARSLFLTAARGPDGERSFRLAPGAPSPTAHAADLYARIFGERLD